MGYNVYSVFQKTFLTQTGTNMEKTAKPVLAQNEFSFYLDAWLYVIKSNLQGYKIERKNWDTWHVVPDTDQT